MTGLVVFQPPVITAELQRQLERFDAGPVRYAGDPGSEDDPGFVLPPERPAYDAAAAAAAEALRNWSEPADRDTIEAWLLMLAAQIGNLTDDRAFSLRLDGIMLTCGELPRVCWTRQTLGEALKKFTFWPSIAEINALLQPTADRLMATLRALDRIASADRNPIRRARESQVPYELPPAPPDSWTRRPSSQDPDPVRDLIRIDPQRVAELLAGLGYPNGVPVPPANPEPQEPPTLRAANDG